MASALLALTVVVALVRSPQSVATTAALLVQAAVIASAAWKTLIAIASLRRRDPAPQPIVWPRYTILAALHDEAAVAPLLIANLARMDYPADRLEVFIVLEAHDHPTLTAVEATPRPSWISSLIVPPGSPLTKPRALNHALKQATGDLLTIYDAEDRPHPGQLREAAARFVAQPRLGVFRRRCVSVRLILRVRPSSTGSSLSNMRLFSTSPCPAWPDWACRFRWAEPATIFE